MFRMTPRLRSQLESVLHYERYYGVGTYIGRKVRYTGGSAPMSGRIVGMRDCGLYIEFDGEMGTELTGIRGPFHPTWEIEYL